MLNLFPNAGSDDRGKKERREKQVDLFISHFDHFFQKPKPTFVLRTGTDCWLRCICIINGRSGDEDVPLLNPP